MVSYRYNKRIVKRICDLIRKDTYTIPEICETVRISERCFYDWQQRNAEFADAIARARADADANFVNEAKKSLMKKITGYEYEETKFVYVDDKGKPKIKEKQTIKRHVQSDTEAIKFVLTNKDPDNWKNRQNSEVTGKGGKDLIPPRVLSPKEIKEYLNQLENEY